MKKQWSIRVIALLSVFVIFASACGDDGGGTSDSATTTTAETTTGGGETTTTEVASAAQDLLTDNGPCDESKPEVKIGLITVFESPVLSLVDQATAAEVSVDAFNARGGVGGHCMNITTCDDGGDPNKAVDCARQFVSDGIVATVNDTTAFNAQGVIDVFTAAGMPRVGISPGAEDLNAPITYAMAAGGFGTTVMMVPPLAKDGTHKKIAIIRVDSPAATALKPLLTPMLTGYGGEFVVDLPVPAGTTNYDQFILSAERAGATAAILPLGENEAVQVLRAAEQLGSELEFSVSTGTFGQADIAEFGDFAQQIVFNNELPPATADPERFPALAVALEDLAASGDDALQPEQLKSSPLRSWLSVYAFVTIMSETDVDNITRESVTAAMNAATDIDMLGMIPPWTPNKVSEGLFSRISQPFYFVSTWDGENFVVGDDQLDVVKELNLPTS